MIDIMVQQGGSKNKRLAVDLQQHFHPIDIDNNQPKISDGLEHIQGSLKQGKKSAKIGPTYTQNGR